ncbi:tetratricopeptide repeat protein [Sphingomonas sp. KRR8]|uniref:tetratricopeptide repeat protein n=1 Tax=Sphingomonas sp. KRR8 TaxID=2942996 RepID=UPI002020B9D9|nr:tetratricopeptide repeat protein [Sphingomonas sp. KRR8]URD59681.1 tetratricopeptide repeat protein [Sphingomonas sp. KRR8]
MALAPGETHESFIREVDENLRRDQAENFVKRYGSWLIAALVLFIVAAGATLWWQEHKRQQAAEHSEQLLAVLNDVAGGRNGKPVQDKLQAIADQSDDEFAALAQMTQGALAQGNGDRAKALAAYMAVAADKGQPQSVRDAALIRQTAVEFDSMKPEDVIARLQPFTEPGNPWFGTAGEMTGAALLKANRKAEAGRLFARIAEDNNVPGGIRSRAQQLASSLGVDAATGLAGGQ